MPSASVKHPLFARAFVRLSGLMERDIGRYRDQLLADLSGRVIEVGAGNGMNFGHYPDTVEEVLAVEPEPFLRAKAAETAGRAPVKVTVVEGVAAELPAPAAQFDAAVASLVLCSVPDPGAAIAEMRRVLKHGGELRFLEHVCGPGSRKARVQRLVDASGIWPRMAGGCHCSRPTSETIAAAGFTIERIDSFDLGPGWSFTNPHLLGVARA